MRVYLVAAMSATTIQKTNRSRLVFFAGKQRRFLMSGGFAAMTPSQIDRFFATLQAANPLPASELEYTSVFELLVAVLLSAQATDVGVNKATRRLFPVANTPQRIIDLGLEGLEGHIKTIGLYRSKARHLMQTCAIRCASMAARCRARAKPWRPCPAWAARPPTWC
jgi:endonuclease-3